MGHSFSEVFSVPDEVAVVVVHHHLFVWVEAVVSLVSSWISFEVVSDVSDLELDSHSVSEVSFVSVIFSE